MFVSDNKYTNEIYKQARIKLSKKINKSVLSHHILFGR